MGIPPRSFFAVLCALALAGILISPAVPSPPTLVEKAIHASVVWLALAVLPPACAVAGVVLGVFALILEHAVAAGALATRPVFLPLRR